ncbi:hypothetical protein ACA910_013122 [Epithemia clementina (nom. ined.)]
MKSPAAVLLFSVSFLLGFESSVAAVSEEESTSIRRPNLRSLQDAEDMMSDAPSMMPSLEPSEGPTDPMTDDMVTDDMVSCGPSIVCLPGEVCCNESCGICTMPGELCIQIDCSGTPTGPN